VFGYRAAITFVACVRSLKLEAQRGLPATIRETEAYPIIRGPRATTDHGRSCIVVVAIRNSFGLSISSSRRGPRAARRRLDRRRAAFGGIRFALVRVAADRGGRDLAMWYIIFR